MHWLWINLGAILGFFVIWFWITSRYFSANSLLKLFNRLILIVVLLDGIFTLIGQPFGYWYDYSKLTEASFIGKMLLTWHPLFFTLFLFFWVILMTFLLSKLRPSLSWALFFSLFIGHSLGMWSWPQAWLENGLTVLVGKELGNISAEFIRYLFYLFLGSIFMVILKKIRRLK